jgi:hypothetical protein
MSIKTLDKIEEMADKEGKGSIFRSCLAYSRSCPEKIKGNRALSLGIIFVIYKQNIINELEELCNLNGSEEFLEAIKAMKNAIMLFKNYHTSV